MINRRAYADCPTDHQTIAAVPSWLVGQPDAAVTSALHANDAAPYSMPFSQATAPALRRYNGRNEDAPPRLRRIGRRTTHRLAIRKRYWNIS